jgi:dGTP triphosphohydrolase
MQNPQEYINPFPGEDSLERRAIDFIAGMTDRYAMKLFTHITFPSGNIIDLLD